MVRLLKFSKKKAPGDVSVSFMGLFLSLLAAFVFFIVLQIQQINLLYEETDEALALSVLSSAVINREDAYSSQQIVIHELDKFDGDITSDAALNILGSVDDEYLEESYDYFLQTFSDNFRLNTNLVPQNPLINSSISIVEYNVYNVWHELDEEGIRTGNFRICKYTYTPESDSWDTTWFPLNQVITVPDALTQNNIPVECSMVSAQIKMTITKFPFIQGIFETSSNLTQDIYYVRNADIIEHEDIIKDREDSSDTNEINPPGTSGIPYYVKHFWQNILDDNYTLVDVQEYRGNAGEEVTPPVKNYEGFVLPEGQTVVVEADGSTVINYYYNRNSYILTLNNGIGIGKTSFYSYDRNISQNNMDSSISASIKYGERIELNAMVLTGYTWDQWSGTYFKNEKNHVFSMPPYDVTLTANTSSDVYSIHYILNGGIQDSSAVTSYTVVDTVILPIPSKIGFTFDGWYENESLTGDAVTVIPKGSTGHKIYFAKWIPLSYIVTYHANNGSFKDVSFVVNYHANGGDFANISYTVAYRSNGGIFSLSEISLNEVSEKYYIYIYDESLGGYILSYITDTTKSVYEPIPTDINGIPVVKIGENAFKGCSNLITMEIPEGVTVISESAFENCTSLASVELPTSIVSIEGSAFSGCTDLTTITFAGTMEQWNKLTKGTHWNFDVSALEVICNDGSVTIS